MAGILPEDLAELTPERLDRIAFEQAELFVNKFDIRASQVRNVYSAITKIRNDYRSSGGSFEEVRASLVMLRPKLAYVAGRHKQVRPFRDLFDEAIEAVLGSKDTSKALGNFFALAEAVVAYHRFHGGRD